MQLRVEACSQPGRWRGRGVQLWPITTGRKSAPRLLSMTTASFQDRFLSGFSGRSILLHTGFSRVETSQMM